MISDRMRSVWVNYIIAILLFVAALLVSWQTGLRDGAPALCFLLAVLLSAHSLGFAPSLAASALAILALDYFFISPVYSVQIENPSDVYLLIAFAVVAIAGGWLAAGSGKSKRRAAMLAHRQELAVRLAQSALAGEDLSQFFAPLAPLLCKAFNVERAGIFRLLPEGQSLELAAGFGWTEGTSGQVVIHPGTEQLDSLLSGQPQVFSHSKKLGTAHLPNFLVNQKVRSGMSVIIQIESQPYGVVGVYSIRPRRFEKQEMDFMKSFADLIAASIQHTRADFQLRQKSEELQNTITSVAEGLIAIDPQGQVTMINLAGQALIGWDSQECLGRRLDDIFLLSDEKSLKPLENPAMAAIRTGKISKLEMRAMLTNKAGQPISIDATASPLCDDAGKIAGAVMTFRDTTVSRQIEETIRRSEERLRVALKNSPVVVYNQDLSLRYTWVLNPAHGYPDQSMIGKTDADMMSLSDGARWSEVKQGVIQTGAGTRVELSATVDSQRRTFDITVEPLLDRDQKLVGVTCASIDITERKREQAAISRLAAIVESSEDAIVGKTLDGIILSWNPGAERMYGYDPDEIIGQSIAVLYPPDSVEECRQIIEQLKRGESVKQHDTVRVRKDGTRIDVSVAISLIRDNMGRVIGASSITRDISQRKALLVENARLVEELHRANEILEQRVTERTQQLQQAVTKLQEEITERRRATEQLRQLSAHLQSAREEERIRVAREIHDELGQVLTVVKMDLSLLERNLPELDKKNVGEELVAQIHATSQLVDDSIQKMRQIIRELRPGILDHLGLKSAIEWQAQEFQAHTGIECQVAAGDEEIPLDLERSTAVFRIFQETLTNVARHAQATRVDVQLKVNQYLILEVCDNGTGISESNVVDGKSFGILGMRERALMLGGELEVRGEPGKGTVVRVRIPLEKQHD